MGYLIIVRWWALLVQGLSVVGFMRLRGRIVILLVRLGVSYRMKRGGAGNQLCTRTDRTMDILSRLVKKK